MLNWWLAGKKEREIIMKTMADRSRGIVTRLFVPCLCCLACSPLTGAEEVAGQAAPVPALTAAEQAAADALLAKHGKAALHHCRMWADKDMPAASILRTVGYLVSKGADVNAKEADFPPLYGAVSVGNAEVVRFLLSKGADAKAANKRGWTLLHGARHADVIRLLVTNGADVRARDEQGLLAFHECVKHGNVEAVRTFVELGADIHEKDGYFNRPALHFAAMDNADIEVTKWLVSKGADIGLKDEYGNTPLFLAAYHNTNIEVMKFLIAQGADVHAKDDGGQTLLHAAAQLHKYQRQGEEHVNVGGVEAARYLVSLGLDAKAQDNSGRTPLHCAASVAVAEYLVSLGLDVNVKNDAGQTPLHTVWDIETVKWLVSQGADVHAKDKQGKTPLDEAATSGKSAKISAFLMSKGLTLDVNATIPGWHGRGTTRLHEAVERNNDWNIEAVKLLVSQGADVNAHSAINGNTPLHDVVRVGYENAQGAGNIGIITYLIEQGADVNATNCWGQTPLFEVTNAKVAELLIAKGADFRAKDKHGRIAYLNALRYNGMNPDVANYFASLGADIMAKDGAGQTLLHSSEHLGAIANLVSLGLDVNARDKRGVTPLLHAAWGGNVERAKCLVSFGADPNAKEGWSNNSMLHCAVQRDHTNNLAFIPYALSFGLDINARNKPGNTPLHLAARLNENVEMCRILVAAGADVNAKNNKGWTPLHDAAKENKNAEVYDFLVSKGADPDAKDNAGLTPRALKPTPRPAVPKGW
jgi:ankyrin repeat protein